MPKLIDAETTLTVQMYDEEHEEWYTEVMTVDELISKVADETPPTVDAVPVDMIKGRIKDLRKMLMDIDKDDVDEIWDLRTKIETLTELLEMWAEGRGRYDPGIDHHADLQPTGISSPGFGFHSET